MPDRSNIDPNKLRAYLATSYRIGTGPNAIVLTVGQRSATLASLFATHGVDCGAFITAYNPRGTAQSATENARAHAQLAHVLHSRGLQFLAGSGTEDGSNWPAELSWFALGLTLSAAREIGTTFDQDAIVWADSDAVPQLILLR